MQTIELTGVIAADHTLTVRLPDGLPGPCKVTVTVEKPRASCLDGLTLSPGKLTDPTDTFRRETLYGDD